MNFMADIGLGLFLGEKVFLFLTIMFSFCALIFVYFDISRAKLFLGFSLGGGVISLLLLSHTKDPWVIFIWAWVSAFCLIVSVASLFFGDKKYRLWRAASQKKKMILIAMVVLFLYMIFMQYQYAQSMTGHFRISHPSLFHDALQIFFFSM